MYIKIISQFNKVKKVKRGIRAMKKRSVITYVLGALFVSLFTAVPVMAAEEPEVNISEVGIISYDSETGITVYRDSAGGTVVSGLMTDYNITAEEQEKQKEMLESLHMDEEDASVYDDFDNDESNISTASSEYVDYEYNPIYIGTWSGTKCYARHTLGKYNSSQKRLTSYGYATWYNTKNLNALPYRNGAANNGSGQGVADVVKGSYFDIRDIGSDKAATFQVNDWGPNQSVAPDKIVDLDRSNFQKLHGNYSDGVFYCRTWVLINNYNPA